MIAYKPSPVEPPNETVILIFVSGFAVGACFALLLEFLARHA